MQRTLRLTEHQLSKGLQLSTAEANWLQSGVSGLDVKPAWGAPGRFDVTPGSHVGMIELPGLTVLIQPKIPVQRVMFLLSYVLDGMNWQTALTTFTAEPELLESMAGLYGLALNQALKRGVQQGYRTRDDTLLTVRGRIRFADQLRYHHGRHIPLEVTFDDYTVDTNLNRLLYAALTRLSTLPLRSARIRALLGTCRAAFADGVTPVRYSRNQLPDLSWNRLNQHFQPAADLARTILESASLELDFGGLRGSSFTVDMNVVFESFVRVALRDALELTSMNWPASSSRLTMDVGRRISLRPDLIWLQDGRAIFVGDVKYKQTGLSGAPNSDLYQLFAYAAALDLPAGLLVYAEGSETETVHQVRNQGTELLIRTLNVDGTPDEVLESVRDMAVRVKELAGHRAESVPL